MQMDQLLADLGFDATQPQVPVPSDQQNLSVTHVFRQNDYIPIPVEEAQAIETLRQVDPSTICSSDEHGTSTCQALLRTTPMSFLMEWDIVNAIARLDPNIPVRATSLRDARYMYFAHEILILCFSQRDVLRIVMNFKSWTGVQVYLIRNQLRFPRDYSFGPLQYGLNFARISHHNVRTTSDNRWFVTPPYDIRYECFPIPGLLLGLNFQPNAFYEFDPLINNYVILVRANNVVTMLGDSQISREFRRRYTHHTSIMMSSFPELSAYSDNRQLLERARAIRCPQEARLYVMYQIQSRWFTYEMNIRNQNRALPQNNQPTHRHRRAGQRHQQQRGQNANDMRE